MIGCRKKREVRIQKTEVRRKSGERIRREEERSQKTYEPPCKDF
jgi:hypothetical protein